MNPQSEEDLQRRLQELETKINNSFEVVQKQTEKFKFPDAVQRNSLFSGILSKFNQLSTIGKLVSGAIAILITLAILQAVLKLVASAISLAILAGLVYFGYKFFISNSWNGKV
ncbi:hypothetical protein [Calothrix sp. 336/3]|uniref:hypothetical protein n=1 Tax=Calothrix sp. 336/3 TaxID=1337936 RepID=UPI0004E2F281|nr:hypothetical protein [Calothrix sp. 336/3]AKG22512.1 hypothetical protein IJ00_15645 [Calothrix sp. 336/3]